ncbi:hypothetical protein P3T76_013373 [Phytophthora citrophthora]|uniref:Nucleolar protein 11 C-terminal domain-containing protein n=1 Tax=Phytophthora citrophthora TaxID=4793 RepID=A0AAD9G314_9STRA|nr:hypothetical protein P3T76_013373 [Phytophthora citrophthora]
MELDQATSLWRGRAADAALLGVSSAVAKDGNRLVLLTSSEDVREINASTRKCVNHWTFRSGSVHALRIPASRHPHSRVFYGVCGAPGVSASKMARQVRRQEANKTTALPANEGLAAWRDTDLDVATWSRAPLQSTSKAFALLVHSKLKEEILVVFQDGSFAIYDEDLGRVLHSDDAKDAATVEEEDEDEDDQEESVVWANLETDTRSTVKGDLFLSIMMQKVNQNGEKQFELLVYQVAIPNMSRRRGGILSVVLLVRRGVNLPNNEMLSACAYHAETFSYSIVGCSGSWQTLRFSRDALTNALTLVASQQMPNLTSSEADSNVPVHKKRKLQAANTATNGYLVSGVGNFTYLISLPLDNALKFTGWDSKFAVPVTSTKISLDTDSEGEVVVGRSSKDGIGKPVQLVSAGTGDAMLAVYERGTFIIPVKNRNSTLASVLGATASSSVENSNAPALPNSSTYWNKVTATSSINNDTLDAETWKANMCSDDDRERQLIADLLDPLVTPTTAAFTIRLDQALQKHNNKRKANKESGELISYRLLQAVTRRCLNSTDLGLWGPLEMMLRTRRLSARAEPTLLPTLMKHNQFSLLEVAIVDLIDIDERSIVLLLKYFIRKSSTSTLTDFVESQVEAETRSKVKIKSKEACQRYVFALLRLPTNSVFLHRAVRELELEEVLLLLGMCKLLQLIDLTATKYKKPKHAKPNKGKATNKKIVRHSSGVRKEDVRFTPLPSPSSYCAWICALLDAHLSALVQRASQDPKISRVLHQLDELVQLQLRACTQYEKVHGVLRNFLSGVQLPCASGLPDYSIEELRL